MRRNPATKRCRRRPARRGATPAACRSPAAAPGPVPRSILIAVWCTCPSVIPVPTLPHRCARARTSIQTRFSCWRRRPASTGRTTHSFPPIFTTGISLRLQSSSLPKPDRKSTRLHLLPLHDAPPLSILGLEANTGIYRTHYSLVPADFHDWDLAAAPVLVTTKARSQEHTSAPPSPTRRSSALDPRPGGEHRHLPDALLPRSRRFSRLGSRCGSSPRHYQS